MRNFLFVCTVASWLLLVTSPDSPAADPVPDDTGFANSTTLADTVYAPEKGFLKAPRQSDPDKLIASVRAREKLLKESVYLVLGPTQVYQPDLRVLKILTDRILVKCSPAAKTQIEAIDSIINIQEADYAMDFLDLTLMSPAFTLSVAERIRQIPGVESCEPQIGSFYVPQAMPSDELFPKQWYLRNLGNLGEVLHVGDLNITRAWDKSKGLGQTIGILDDGVDIDHPDLKENVKPALCYDFQKENASTSLAPHDKHGTACAGIAAARGFDRDGICGVAPRASIAALRLFSGPVTTRQLAQAFAFRKHEIGIKAILWSPSHDFVRPGPAALAAIEDACRTGRSGKGTVFVSPAGNGGRYGRNSNADGFANMVQTITVGATTSAEKRTDFSSSGSNVLVVAPATSFEFGSMVTTDVHGNAGYEVPSRKLTNTPVAHRTCTSVTMTPNIKLEVISGDYYEKFGGTSAACASVAGVVALILEANNNLDWRTVQDVLVRSAKKNDEKNPEWITNRAGLHFHPDYGAGLVDAEAAVNRAKTAKVLPPMTIVSVPATGLPAVISGTANSTIEIPVKATNIALLEHVVVRITTKNCSAHGLKVTLTAPSGVKSVLSSPVGIRSVSNAPMESSRRTVTPNAGGPPPIEQALTHGPLNDWPFMTVRNWGESPNGIWRITIMNSGSGGTLDSVSLVLYGSAMNAAASRPNPAH